jgi:hypothetical protein
MRKSESKIRIKCLADYVQEVERLLGVLSNDGGISSWGVWYRGNADSTWGLLPGLYRPNSVIPPEREREAVRDFRLNASPLLDDSPMDDAEWLFIMQHYSMPTRLLDWTENYLTALYFATCKEDTPTDGCVWLLSPITLNDPLLRRRRKPQRTVPTSDHPIFRPYLLKNSGGEIDRKIGAKYPLAFRPARKSTRIVSQKGTFTIHGSSKCDIGNLKTEEGYENLWVKKILIDSSCKGRLASELYRAGVTAYTIYRDLDHLSEEIKFRYSTSYSMTERPANGSAHSSLRPRGYRGKLERSFELDVSLPTKRRLLGKTRRRGSSSSASKSK